MKLTPARFTQKSSQVASSIAINELLNASISDPEALRKRALHAWQHLQPSERNTLTAASILAFPGDMEGQQKYVRASLLQAHLTTQQNFLLMLNNELGNA
jgi:hypothetical protein